ncbi:nucleoside 2-deoxyribosyltransferase [Shewanella sp. SM29]|uniref:nucleoside 2-deoxyribosyltransferase n=1 Tax=Shewanella sp. SM29 TaxID=2912795 RepID=UPI0021D98192|nr:nucleoside 2-deoxyribosyltransferase [Shewanella sp. SM29]MCU8075023.1 nucleoside 2-deoxyribosyltransferase [Shewanella sp. SM29]
MLLILGEVFVDFTLPTSQKKCKLRLGGIVHACRGLWAANIPYSVAIICPSYLQKETSSYLKAHGCSEVIFLGEIIGAPNVIAIADPTEVSEQGYEDLLRETKEVLLNDVFNDLCKFNSILIFPGSFDLNEIIKQFSTSAVFSIDIAYGVDSFSSLNPFKGRLLSIITSTSSDLFIEHGRNDIASLLKEISSLGPSSFLLKENRGGSRLFDFTNNEVLNISSTLDRTVNSVGVGDVYSAIVVALASDGRCWKEASRVGALAATHYSQTTFPDDFKRDLHRSLLLPIEIQEKLGGTFLPWHERNKYSIYFAAPDFSYVDRTILDRVLACLSYHNFTVKRPIIENGELNAQSNEFERIQTFHQDIELINQCDVVFAVPLGRDPGTLAEVGIAFAQKKPVITYDPKCENDNNMITVGSTCYSDDMDLCLNSLFITLSNIEKERK